MSFASVVPLLYALLIIIVLTSSVRVLPKGYRGVVFRLGRFVSVVGPGLVFIVPFIDLLKKVNLDHLIPGWGALSEEEIKTRVEEKILNDPSI